MLQLCMSTVKEKNEAQDNNPNRIISIERMKYKTPSPSPPFIEMRGSTPIKTKESTAKPKKIVVDNPLTGINNYQKLVVPRYLKNAPGKGKSFVKDKDLNLNVFVDSDWAKCKATRKSVTTEYRAMNTVTFKVIWIHKILSEPNIKISLPVPKHCDNNFAIQIAANPEFHEKTKHFKIKLFFLREKVSTGVVKTLKVKSANNVADIFTKGLSVQDHNKFCDMLGLFDMYKC
ncbi:hypothetical protein Tco_1325042 [Tanacetum coccineum]